MALVRFKSVEEALAAIVGMRNYLWDGTDLHLRVSFSKAEA